MNLPTPPVSLHPSRTDARDGREVKSRDTILADQAPQRRWPLTLVTPQYCVGVVLGCVLLVAAALKVHHLVTGGPPANTLLTSRTSQLLIVESELVLGVWLLTGFYQRLASRAALIYFAALAAVSAYFLVTESGSCGCAGRLAVNPWFTFAFNLAAICALSLCPRRKDVPDGAASRPVTAAIVFTAYCFLSVYAVMACSDLGVTSTQMADSGADGAIVALDFENWRGRRLPVLDHVGIGRQLGQGRWVVVFYHDNCPRCDDAIRHAEERLKGDGGSVALIRVPSLGGDAAWVKRSASPNVAVGQLDPSRRWVAETPWVILVEQGIVTQSLASGSK